MLLTQVRNATLKLEYAGNRILVDPMLADKDAYPGFEGTVNSHLRNPLVALPMPVEELLDVDAILVTHLHPDHWDEAARTRVPRDMPILTQNGEDAEVIRAQGFTRVVPFTGAGVLGDIALTRTPGQHGSDAAMAAAGARLGRVSGVVLRHPDEKSLYIAGDTVWNGYVADTLATQAPDVVVLNCGDAGIEDLGSIIMNAEDVREVHRAAPDATLVASHMEAVNHCVLTREQLRAYGREQGMAEHLLVPEDGEPLTL
ncbi:MBL fold metallo-hydrolase [Aquisalimonas lutea]|uniref:MBL fold metallo-hydrolase n=1 Tax=Aquisalimonas lutea TaxID=1327750 RepID=UPI0025B44CBD|nr:MBL fold metallo-hydrolase [Aquisalimonas lutea]MDN3519822.1 MBL fold metallo-hydrolase [Aquisalimonas lutea]